MSMYVHNNTLYFLSADNALSGDPNRYKCSVLKTRSGQSIVYGSPVALDAAMEFIKAKDRPSRLNRSNGRPYSDSFPTGYTSPSQGLPESAPTPTYGGGPYEANNRIMRPFNQFMQNMPPSGTMIASGMLAANPYANPYINGQPQINNNDFFIFDRTEEMFHYEDSSLFNVPPKIMSLSFEALKSDNVFSNVKTAAVLNLIKICCAEPDLTPTNLYTTLAFTTYEVGSYAPLFMENAKGIDITKFINGPVNYVHENR